MADLDVLPELFGVGTVTFKAGSEFPLLNRLLGGAAALRARTGHPRLEAYTSLVRGLSWLVGRFGNDAGGVIFEVVKDRGISLLSIIEIPHPVSIRMADYWVMVGSTSSVMRSATATGSSQCGQAPPRPTRWQNTPQSGQRCSPR